MRSPTRKLALAGTLVALGAAVFLVPTLWGRPWSIEHFYTRVFLELLLRHPMLLTQLRVLEPYGIRFHNRELDDFSVAAQREEVELARRALDTLHGYPLDAQTASQRRSSEVLAWFLQVRVDGEPFLLHDYPLNQLDGVQVELPDFMVNVHPLFDARDAEDYVARLARFGPAIDQVIEAVRARAAQGVVPPRFVVERVRDQVETFRRGGPDANVLLVTFAERLGRLDAIAPETRRELVAAARREVAGTVLPAWDRLATLLPELGAAAGDDVGVWRLPDGARYYAWALRYHTTTERSADEIHALGLAEVARIQTEMRALLAELDPPGAAPEGAPDGAGAADPPLGDVLRALQRDERFLYPDTDGARDQILADYQAIVDAAAPQLPALFGRLPAAPVRVERIPPFKEDGAPGAYYLPPPLDSSRPGVFYVNLRSVSEIPKLGMRTLAYHEAIPGHHLQLAIALELEDLPIFRRVVPFTAYTEGWALYAERLALEEGFHPTPADRLGALIAEAFRAVRLVVDTGLHAKRWSREQAIDYMLQNTGMPETDVVAEVERYIVSPGQACAYKVGQLEILRLRAEAAQALGARFELPAFHDAVLTQGALPLELLDETVGDWVADQSGAGAVPGPLRRLARRTHLD